MPSRPADVSSSDPAPSSRTSVVEPGLRPSTGRLDVLFKFVLAIFAGSMAFSIAGMLLLLLFPTSVELFGPYLQELVAVPTWVYMGLLPVLPALMYAPALGWKRLLLFAAIGCGIGGGSELIGTNVGIPFGAYSYTQWLGPKILGDVPYFIPPSWFAMSILSLDLARRVVGPERARAFRRILVATVFMVLWDVSLDPAMNGAGVETSPFTLGMEMFWYYPTGSFYYGMPWTNWAGWFVVTFLITTAYELLTGGLPSSHRWAPAIYGLNCLFPIVLCALYGLQVAALIGAAATAVPLTSLYLSGERLRP